MLQTNPIVRSQSADFRVRRVPEMDGPMHPTAPHALQGPQLSPKLIWVEAHSRFPTFKRTPASISLLRSRGFSHRGTSCRVFLKCTCGPGSSVFAKKITPGFPRKPTRSFQYFTDLSGTCFLSENESRSR